MATSNTVHYAEITVWHCVLLPTTLWTLPLLVISLITFSYLWTVCQFLCLGGKLLQTVKLLTCVRGTSSSWNTAFQPKDSKLHTECKSHDRLWRVQYCVYTSYCCCSNLYTRITEHHNNQPHVLTAPTAVQLVKPSCHHVVSSQLAETSHKRSNQ